MHGCLESNTHFLKDSLSILIYYFPREFIRFSAFLGFKQNPTDQDHSILRHWECVPGDNIKTSANHVEETFFQHCRSISKESEFKFHGVSRTLVGISTVNLNEST